MSDKVMADADVLARAINEALAPFVGEGYGKVAGFRCMVLMNAGEGVLKQFEASGSIGDDVETIMKDPRFMSPSPSEESEASVYTIPRARRN